MTARASSKEITSAIYLLGVREARPALHGDRCCGSIAGVTVKLLAFAQAADQLGFRERAVECTAAESAREVLRRVAPEFDAPKVRVAVDEEYVDWDAPIGEAREIALIPPVSGG